MHKHHTTRAGLSQKLLDAFYTVPDPLDTYEQLWHWDHADLDSMDRSSLLAERQLLRLRLLLDPSPDAWLLDRAARVEEAVSHGRR
jgi:hypothetical protein